MNYPNVPDGAFVVLDLNGAMPSTDPSQATIFGVYVSRNAAEKAIREHLEGCCESLCDNEPDPDEGEPFSAPYVIAKVKATLQPRIATKRQYTVTLERDGEDHA